MTLSLKLEAVPIRYDSEVEQLRILRNATSEGFTSFNGSIEPEQQAVWWKSMRGRIHAWLYKDGDRIVGFGLLRVDSTGRWWNSLGVHPDFHGHGYGSYITHDLLERHTGPVYAAVRRDNSPAIAMHHTDEWQEIDGPDQYRLIYFRSI